MGKLNYVSYVWKCIAGAEILYFLCVFGAFVFDRSTVEGTELHRRLFETMPGFVWLTPASVVIGALYMALFSVIFGVYIVWMHNSSIQE